MSSYSILLQEQLEQLREQRRQLEQLQRTAAAPSARRESFRLIITTMIMIMIMMITRVLIKVFIAYMFRMNNVDANFRSLPAFSSAAPSAPAQPYVSYGAEAGSYTISY